MKHILFVVGMVLMLASMGCIAEVENTVLSPESGNMRPREPLQRLCLQVLTVLTLIVCDAALHLCAHAQVSPTPRSLTNSPMATVDGRQIFRSDVNKYYENQVASAQQPPTGAKATILRLNILRQVIDDEMVISRAEQLGSAGHRGRGRPQVQRDQVSLYPGRIRSAVER